MAAKVFTREEADEALVYVRRIAEDIQCKLQQIRLSESRTRRGETEFEQDFELGHLREEIRRHVKEVEQLGCTVTLRDEIAVDFPAIIGGDLALWTWKPGEERIHRWRRPRRFRSHSSTSGPASEPRIGGNQHRS